MVLALRMTIVHVLKGTQARSVKHTHVLESILNHHLFAALETEFVQLLTHVSVLQDILVSIALSLTVQESPVMTHLCVLQMEIVFQLTIAIVR